MIEVHWIPFTEAYEWAVGGKIRDGKTALGIVRAQQLRSRSNT